MTALDDTVTVIVKRKVRPEHQLQFEQWSHGVIEEAARFDGHLGATLLTPDVTGGENLLLFRFDSPQHLAAWNRSPVKEEWLARISDITVGEIASKQIAGLEFWFRAPGIPPGAAPARYKMAIVTMIGIYPLSLALTTLLGRWLAPFPIYARGLVITVAMVGLMTYPVMPLLTRWFRRWLFPAAR